VDGGAARICLGNLPGATAGTNGAFSRDVCRPYRDLSRCAANLHDESWGYFLSPCGLWALVAAVRQGPEVYLCATCVFGSGMSCTRLSVAQEPAAQVIGVSNFVGTRFGPSVDREIIGQLPSGL
jgi:hypothetical protein